MKMPLLSGILKDTTASDVKRLQPIVATINALGSEIEALDLAAIKDEFMQLRNSVQQQIAALPSELEVKAERRRINAILERVLPRAFALVREAAWRAIGLRHYDVQLIGGTVLHRGKIAEMKTGEGKTLVATLPLALNALTGRGAHLVTVNDYLARRDAGWMGPVYHALGLTVGFVGHETSLLYDPSATLPNEDDPRLAHFRPCTRSEAYAADITYGTNNEFGFDYLRDNMEYHVAALRQRTFNFAIVDEVDSILIDEARTPLIISGPACESEDLYATFARVVPSLKAEADYTVDEKDRAVSITDSGIHKMEKVLDVPNLYDKANIHLVHHLEEALKAHALFKRNKDYVVKDGEVVIVDEFTGRLMHGRRYSEGLHQAIEAKEKVTVQRETETLATISFQNLFRLYPKLAGMTGTAATEAEEFWKIYELDVVVVPTHRSINRIDRQDIIYKTEAAKFAAVVAEIASRQAAGQPVLVGTISVAKSEKLSRALKQAGIKHSVLNAKYHEREAKIIEHAGEPGAVTVATNMAGRGVDILLGGVFPAEAKNADKHWEASHQTVLGAGGLCVIGTERHESRRIDNQLRGRSGRQGDPGETQFFVSMDDDLMRIFGGDRLKAMMERLGLPDDQPIGHSLISRSIESAQKKVEGHNFDIRKHLVEYDDVMSKHREIIYRKRRRILELSDFAHVNWLHDELLSIMTDGQAKQLNELVSAHGIGVVEQAERFIYLRTIDQYWIEHLNQMEELRTGIGLRGYGQTDPLVEYKREAYNIFERLLASIEEEVAGTIVQIQIQAEQPVTELTGPVASQLSYQGADEALAGGQIHPDAGDPPDAIMPSLDISSSADRSTVAPIPPAEIELKVGRNDPCPCGAKKSDGTPVKYKHCHGRDQ